MNRTISNRSIGSGDDDDDDNDDVHIATRAINAFLPWVIILVGVVFNALIVLGMRTKSFRSLSTSVFMTVGAVNDLTSIPILLIPHWLHVNFPESISRGAGSDFLCKFFSFYGWGQADFGMMLLSAMTADRAYVILRPMTTVDLVRRAKIVTGVCVGVVVAKEFHFWFYSVMVPLGRNDRLCDVSNSSAAYNEFYRGYWPWIDTVFVTLCFVVMVVSNCVLIRHIRRNRKGGGGGGRELKTRGGTPPSPPGAAGAGAGAGPGGVALTLNLTRSPSTMSIHAGASYSGVGRQVTRMLLAESLALFLLSYPFSVHLMVTSQIPDLNHHPDKARANALAFNVVFYLLYANKCVNFLVYCRAGKKFRKAVANEVLCRFRCGGLQFGKGRGFSESGGDGSFQSPGAIQQQLQQQQQEEEEGVRVSEGRGRRLLRSLWNNVAGTVTCGGGVSCKTRPENG
ncbi:uncharacterized protein LOC143301954 [Babylonia areolata]|uniref:uncharacterized protein LOC143301954 n=1 Tax=Babylonia areolata TaxID=304850 RepID=UPI003FCFF766